MEKKTDGPDISPDFTEMEQTYGDEEERIHDKCISFLEATREGTDIAETMKSYGTSDSTAKMLLSEV